MASSTGPDVVTDGLVLALDGGDSTSYPGTGTTWTDLSGNGYNGTLVNGVGYDSGNGGSLTFDNIDDYVVNNSFSLGSINSGATLSTWVNTNNPKGSGGGLIFDTNRSNNSRFYILVNAVQAGSWQLGLGESFILTQVLVNENNIWEFISMTVENGNYKFYVNGVLSKTGSYVQSSNPVIELYIGASYVGNNHYDGKIAQTLVYNRNLSESEVQQNFNATRSRFGI